MKNCILSLVLLVLIPGIQNAMELNLEEFERELSTIEYRYKGPHSITCKLIKEPEIIEVANKDAIKSMHEQMELMIKQVTNPETTTLFADVLKLYKDNLYPNRPWCGSRSKSTQRNLKLLIKNLKNQILYRKEFQKEYETNLSNSQDSLEDAELNQREFLSEVELHQKEMRKLMAAQVAFILLNLNESEQVKNRIQKKFDEIKAKKV